jgi:2-oxoacid:acceptor oxidoreductase delta subunit (pyruvate/2-ketoisovalerate family)
MKKRKSIKTLFGPVATKISNEKTGTWRTRRPNVNQSECVRCGICAEYCPTGVMAIKPEGDIAVVINFDNCKGCGICANLCPRTCIEMISEGDYHA